MEESKDCIVDIIIDILFRRKRKKRKIFGKGEYLFFWKKRKPQKEKEENIWRRSLEDIEKFWFRSPDFSQLFGGFRYRFQRIWSRRKVSVLVLENLVSEKNLGFGFREFGFGKKVLVSVSENLVSEKKSWFQRIWIWIRSKFWYRHSVVLRKSPWENDFPVVKSGFWGHISH